MPPTVRPLAVGQHHMNRVRPTFMDAVCTLVTWWGPRMRRASAIRAQIVQTTGGFVLDIHWEGAE
jgi:hypothetical protein